MRNANGTERSNLLRALKLAAALISLVLLTLAGIAIVQWIHYSPGAEQFFAFDSVEFVGVKNLDKPSVSLLIRKSMPRNLLMVDLEKVRALVKTEPWVKEALVRRCLPDRLIIHIDERTPVAVAAIDDGLFIVDREGVVLRSQGPDSSFPDLPIVRGLRNVARENAAAENALRMNLYLSVLNDFRAGPKDYIDSLSEVDVTDRARVAVIPQEEPVPVYLGRDRFLERYESFLSQRNLFDQLKEKYGQIEYVDVTHENRIIFHTPKTAVTG